MSYISDEYSRLQIDSEEMNSIYLHSYYDKIGSVNEVKSKNIDMLKHIFQMELNFFFFFDFLIIFITFPHRLCAGKITAKKTAAISLF